MIWIKLDDTGEIYKWVKENLKDQDRFRNDLTIGVFFDKRLIAAIVLSKFSDYNVYLTIYSEDKSWCSRRVINFLYDYIFNVLSYKKITCIAAKGNKKVRKFLTKLGFRLEGVIRHGRLNGASAFFYGLQHNDKARFKFIRR